MNNYRVRVCREQWGYIDVEANSENEAIEKVECYEHAENEEFISTNIGNQAVYTATKIDT